MAKSKRSGGGYQVCIHVGPRPEGIPDEAKFIELRIESATPEAVLAALAAAELSPGDFRTEAVCSIDADRDTAVLTYAALIGYAQRRLDLISGGRIVDADRIDSVARSIPDAGKPDTIPVQVQVGVVENIEVPSILFSSQLSAADASSIRYARRARFAPADEVSAAITQLLVVCGLRARGNVDRFPYLVSGLEPAAPADSPLQVPGVCLDTLRAEALDLRRKHRIGDRRCLVEAEQQDPRRLALELGAAVPIEVAMRLLGARQNPDTGLWHCPRPDRHNNGDANASMRTMKGQVRCYRCDGERVDSLRLAMDVLGLSPDEAAAWLVEKSSSASSAELDSLFS